jgi:tetratricopeptide (TPR) repeat protein
MKTSERHRLKENDLALAIARAQVWIEANQRGIAYGAAMVVVALLGVASYLLWQNTIETRGRTLLAEAMVTYESRVMPPATPADEDAPAMTAQMPGTFPSDRARLEAALPKFETAADAYPATDAGRTARFHAAAVLVSLGRYDEAIAQYDQLLGGADVVARMARFGRAEALVQAAKYDEAIAAYQAMMAAGDARIPVESVLMELARTYELAGLLDDARTTLTTVVEQHADSPFAPTAREALERLRG